MKFKLHGNDIIFQDALNIKMAEFDKEFVKQFDKRYFIARTNFGHRILSVYQTHRSDMHIANVMKMLEKMEQLYTEYEEELIKIGRTRG